MRRVGKSSLLGSVAGAACKTDKEAQQMMFPIQMVMIIPWFVMTPIITAANKAE